MALNKNLLLPGDIILTRNFNEEDNSMPGYYNHSSVFSGNSVIESQMPPINSVIQSDIDEFATRYGEYKILRRCKRL